MKTLLWSFTIVFLLALCSAGSVNAQTIYTSTASGAWSTMTWSPAGTPGASDEVIIADAHDVIIDQNITIKNLTVGGGVSGRLSFDGTTGRLATISGNITVNTGGSFLVYNAIAITGDLTYGNTTINNVSSTAGIVVGMNIAGNGLTGATVSSIGVPTPTDIVVSVSPTITGAGIALSVMPTLKDSLVIGGNLTNNGTLDMSLGSITTLCNVTFNKLGAQTVTGSGTTTRFQNVTLAKTDTTQKVNASINVTVTGNFMKFTAKGGWAQSAGTLTINGNQVIAANNQIDIGSTGNMTVMGDMAFAGNLVVNTSGTVNFGVYGENRFVQFQTSGCKGTFTAGTINVYGKLYMATTNSKILINGAAINVDPTANASGDYGFRVLNNTPANFTFTSGTITVLNPSSASGTNTELNIAAGFNMAGTAKIVIGQGLLTNTSSTFGGIRLGGAGLPNMGNLEINSGSCPTLVSGSMGVNGTLTLTSGIFNDSGYTVTAKGDVYNNATHVSSIVSLPSYRAGKITMAHSGAHTLYGNGIFGRLSLNDTLGTTIAGNPIVTDTFKVVYCTASLGGNTLTLNGIPLLTSGGTVSTTSASSLVFGGSFSGVQLPASVTALNNLTLNNPNGITLNSSPTITGTLTLTSGAINAGAFAIMFGPSGTLLYNGASAQTTTDAEFPVISGPANLSVNNASGVILNASRTVAGTVNLNAGVVTTGSNILTVGGAVTRTTGRINGYLKKTIGVGTSVSQTFEIGDATNYTPVTVAFGSVSGEGTLTASTSPGSHPNFGASGLAATKKLNRFYTLTNNGTTFNKYTATLNFAAGDIDAGANTANFVVKKYDGAAWSTPATANPLGTSIQATDLTSFSDFAVGEALNTLTVNGANGSVGLAPAGGSYAPGTSVVLTPAANSGYRFHHWTGDVPAGHETDNPLTVVMDANKSLTAVFVQLHTIGATAVNGTITPVGSLSVEDGSNAVFTFAPATGYHLDSLIVDNVKIDTATVSYTFTNVTGPHTIVAKFAINTYSLTVNTSHGTVVKDPNLSVYEHGASVVLTPSGDSGYVFFNWSGDVPVGHENDKPLTLTVDRNMTVTANFTAAPTHIIAATAVNGTISPSGDVVVVEGLDKQFTYTPNAGYHFDSVLVDSNTSTDSTLSYTMFNVLSAHTIQAFFSINTYTITSGATNGTISPTPDITVNYGSTQTFTYAPSTGFHFDSLVVDGMKNIDSTASFTLRNVTSIHTLHAYFSINTYTITSGATNGTISPTPDITVNYGSTQTFTYAPSTGFHFDSLVVDGMKNIDSTASFTLRNVISSHAIHVYFSINKFTITASAGNGGTITPPGSTMVDYDGSQAYTFGPATGYYLDSLMIDGVKNNDSTSSYTFKFVTASHSIRVVFKIHSYAITVTPGVNGTITPGTTILNYGAEQAFTIAPASGYHLDSIIVDGGSVDSTTSYTFTNVTAPHTIRAYFTINAYTITPAVHGGGSINPSTPVVLAYGSSREFTFSPNPNWHFDSLKVDGIKVDNATTSYLFTSIAAHHSITVFFSLDQVIITVISGDHGTVTPGTTTLTYGGSQRFVFTPDEKYAVDAVLIDGVQNSDSTAGYTFTSVALPHTLSVTFAVTPAYAATYRTVASDSLALAVDGKGKSAMIGTKADKYDFTFTVRTPATGDAVTGVYFEFASKIVASMPFSCTPSGTFAPKDEKLQKYTVTFNAPLTAGETVTFTGYAVKAEKIAKYNWIMGATNGPAIPGKPVVFTNVAKWPMPNRINIAAASFAQATAADKKFTLPVGLKTADKKKFGWLELGKYTDLMKTLVEKSVQHTGDPKGFSTFDKSGKPILGKQTALPPSKQNNMLVADLSVLKLNIMASAQTILPIGLGELRYADPDLPLNPLNSMLVRQIADYADTVMMGAYNGSVHEFDGAMLTWLHQTASKINSAFEGTLDTLSFAGAAKVSANLQMKGAKALVAVPYLHVSGVAPTKSSPVAAQEQNVVPVSYALYQNYPNPFNPTTTLRYDLPMASIVTLKIYNILGQEVATLLNNAQVDEGQQEVVFSATKLSSGVYFYRLDAQSIATEDGSATEHFTKVSKMMLIK